MQCTTGQAMSILTAFTKLYARSVTCRSSSLESGSTITDVHSLSSISALLLRCRCHPEQVDTSLKPQPQTLSKNMQSGCSRKVDHRIRSTLTKISCEDSSEHVNWEYKIAGILSVVPSVQYTNKMCNYSNAAAL